MTIQSFAYALKGASLKDASCSTSDRTINWPTLKRVKGQTLESNNRSVNNMDDDHLDSEAGKAQKLNTVAGAASPSWDLTNCWFLPSRPKKQFSPQTSVQKQTAVKRVDRPPLIRNAVCRKSFNRRFLKSWIVNLFPSKKSLKATKISHEVPSTCAGVILLTKIRLTLMIHLVLISLSAVTSSIYSTHQLNTISNHSQ